MFWPQTSGYFVLQSSSSAKKTTKLISAEAIRPQKNYIDKPVTGMILQGDMIAGASGISDVPSADSGARLKESCYGNERCVTTHGYEGTGQQSKEIIQSRVDLFTLRYRCL